jgi:single-strand DNA-binding protein
MKTMNRVELVGYLGNDPVSKTAANGSKMVRLRMATDHYRKDKEGKIICKVSWHDILAWDRLAEEIPGHYIRGSHVLVQGEIRYRIYVDPQGQQRSVTEIKAFMILNLDR